MPEGFPKFLYHPKHAPKGRIFNSTAEVTTLGRGWVDTPAKFPKPSRVVAALAAVKPLWEEWKWLATAVAAALVIAAAAVKFLEALHWL